MSTKCEQLQDEIKDLQDDLTRLADLWSIYIAAYTDENGDILVPESEVNKVAVILGL